MNTKERPEWLTVSEIAAELRVTDRVVYKWIREEILQAVRFGGVLGIGVESARSLMSSGAIRSQLYATTTNGRSYYRTTESAIVDYLDSARLTSTRPAPQPVMIPRAMPRPDRICHA
jgi:excisionase family DNA binding protein